MTKDGGTSSDVGSWIKPTCTYCYLNNQLFVLLDKCNKNFKRVVSDNEF